MNREKVIDRLRKQEVFIITHIPKTSGSSISHILREQKSDVFWPHYEKTDDVPTYISGHMCYGIHKLWGLDEKMVKYCVILRDPVKRWKSVFNYALMRYYQGAIKGGIVVFFEACGGDIKKFLEWCLDNSSNRDVMTKVVSGAECVSNIDGYKDHYEKNGKLYFSQMGQTAWAKRKNEISNEEMDRMMETSKYNLINKYHFVGFMEDKDNQKKMCEILGLNLPKEQIFKRKSNKRKEINWEDNKIDEMLVELNKYDIELYNFALNNISDF